MFVKYARRVAFVLSFCAAIAWGQSDRGTITGTVTDSTGAVLAGATLEAKNTNTGAVYPGGTTGTGNYNIAQVPVGTYQLTVTMPGFKNFVRPNIVVPVATTVRVDVTMEVGNATESITVTDAAPLLKTESGELSHNVDTARLNNLPVLGIGGARAGNAGIRNPYAVVQILPGSDFRPDNSVRLNGNPSNTQSLRIEGQDATNNLINTQSQTQPSVEAIEEFAIQTSNFAAEYGQVAGGFFNATMKSGTNAYHGSAYEYFVNEALNAGQAFTTNGSGEHIRSRQRRNDWGFSGGGPVWIPKLYDGHNKTFFFFNYEQFRENTTNTVATQVPTLLYRQGDFSQAWLTQNGGVRNVCPGAAQNPNVGCDPLGRPIYENQVYDPLSTFLAPNGLRVRNPFPNNRIPVASLDPVAVKIQNLIPLPNTNGTSFQNNYFNPFANSRLTYIPSVKLDHQVSNAFKLSGFWQVTKTYSPNNTSFPFPLNNVQNDVTAHTIRVTGDYTITPTLLFHAGVGLLHNYLDQIPGRYDVIGNLGLKGTFTPMFPSMSGLSLANGGGVAGMGPGSATQLLNTKPTANTSITWVHGNHTTKAGGELVVEGFPVYNETYTNSWMVFAQPESGIPTSGGIALAAQPGFNYASMLLGGVDNGYIGVPSKSRLGNKALSGFVQDTWKVTRKFTFDYGLRYDFQTYLKEQYGRIGYFSPSTPNPAAGGKLGGLAFDGYGPGHCNCDVAHNYPWGFAPRLGAAYQINSKTVLRGGIGLSYYRTAMNGLNSLSTGSQYIYSAPGSGEPAYYLRNGLPFNISWPNFDPGQVPLNGVPSAPGQQIDRNAGRPARTLQYSIGIQRQITKDFVVEASYVGNRGVWWNSTYLVSPNAQQVSTLQNLGLDITNASDRAALTAGVLSSAAAAKGFVGLPYPNFPVSQTLAQALRPFPQFTNITNIKWVPTGKNWYDSLQIQATKRYSHGLDLTSSFTWSRTFTLGTEADISTIGPSGTTPAINDVFNRNQNKYLSGLDQPFLFVLAANYTTPRMPGNKYLGWITKDWVFGTVLRYGSGFPIMAPLAQNGLNSILFRGSGPGNTGGTFANRVAGQPFFTQDLNCRCFDPNKDFVLNPKAWSDPAAGTFGTSAAYYTDYRQARRPSESMSLGRIFQFKEGRYKLQIRAEFANIFNRTYLNNPTSNNALSNQTRNPAGIPTAGFGFINTASVQTAPRSGTLVGRFTF